MNFPELQWRRFFLAAGISLAVPLMALAVSQRATACGVGQGMEGGKMPPHLRVLNLTETQRDKIFDVMHAQAPAMRDKIKVARNADDALRKLVLSPEYTEPKARELAESSARAMADISLARAKAERQVYDLLTAEQRKQLAELKAGEPPMDGRGDGPRGDRGSERGGDRAGERRPPPAR